METYKLPLGYLYELHIKHMDILITLRRNEIFKNCIYFFVVYVYVYMMVRGNFKELVLPFHHVGFGIWTHLVRLSSKCPFPTELRNEILSMMEM